MAALRRPAGRGRRRPRENATPPRPGLVRPRDDDDDDDDVFMSASPPAPRRPLAPSRCVALQRALLLQRTAVPWTMMVMMGVLVAAWRRGEARRGEAEGGVSSALLRRAASRV